MADSGFDDDADGDGGAGGTGAGADEPNPAGGESEAAVDAADSDVDGSRDPAVDGRRASDGADAEGSDATEGADPVPPTDVFALLANETRLAIVRELAKHRWSNWVVDGLSFAELRRAVGERDAGNFSYHLDKLTGTLVFERGDEYVLSNGGLELAGAVAAGTYTSDGDARRSEIDYDCPHDDCDRSLVAAYDHQYFRVLCPDHYVFSGATLPPSAAEHKSMAELATVAVLENTQNMQRARAGVCPLCSGPMETTLPVSDPTDVEHSAIEPPADAVMVGFDCDRCGMAYTLPAGICLVDHPAVVSLYHDHGRDVRGELWTEFPFLALTGPDVESTDPVRVRVDVEVGGDTLSAWLDDEANVVEYERS